MIESWYWKEDLLAHSKKLLPVAKPPRWSERAAVTFEKELMISFFMVRALLERRKLSRRVAAYRMSVILHPWNGKRVNVMNYQSVADLYDFDNAQEKQVSIGFLSNQFIHARAIFAARDETRNWSHVLLCSDYEKEKAVYLVSTMQIQAVFRLVATDQITRLSYTYNDALRDYDIETN